MVDRIAVQDYSVRAHTSTCMAWLRCVHTPLKRVSVPARESSSSNVSTPTGRERMGPSTLQPLQDPILLLPWLCFRGGVLTAVCGCAVWGWVQLTGRGVRAICDCLAGYSLCKNLALWHCNVGDEGVDAVCDLLRSLSLSHTHTHTHAALHLQPHASLRVRQSHSHAHTQALSPDSEYFSPQSCHLYIHQGVQTGATGNHARLRRAAVRAVPLRRCARGPLHDGSRWGISIEPRSRAQPWP
jgi:hypothetical protein